MTPHLYQAVILAAGRGSRLSERTSEIPKALLPLGPHSLSDARETNFLKRQVDVLRDLGVDDIVVVVGTLGHMIEEEVKGWTEPVALVVNPTPDMATSGSLHSFQYAVRSPHGVLAGDKQTLLMDADIVYDRRALSLLLEAPPETSMLVAGRHAGDQEEVRVYGTLREPRFLGKGLTDTLVAGEPCLGEAAGIVKFAPADHALVRETVAWLLGDPDAPKDSPRYRGYGPARRATEHEELTQRFMRYRKMRCVCFGEDIPFMECDNAEEYKRVREVFYPQLIGREAQ
ncbi:MAG: NTP transferase domain-containing protein [Myxococcales bacterium]|nr:NTP transferase domain-containing protein [Myxococcales bacterium]MDD9966387.1 NTP transferase domain-containing protein [Myxococcales bacterium]